MELCCGRGGGLVALERLGFARIAGVDRWHGGLRRYRGRAKVIAADVRRLPLADASHDVAIVQGGLHHLEDLDHDLEGTLAETQRILRPNGRFVAVEPWRTPFLDIVDALSRVPLIRRVSPRADAFATMVELEGATYERWLASAEAILAAVRRWFSIERMTVRLGKCMLVARKEMPAAYAGSPSCDPTPGAPR